MHFTNYQSDFKQSMCGFTLIELMISVVVIGVLATIAIPAYQKYTTQAKFAMARTELKPFETILETANAVKGDGWWARELSANSYSPYGSITQLTPSGLMAIGLSEQTSNCEKIVVSIKFPDYQISCQIRALVSDNQQPGLIMLGRSSSDYYCRISVAQTSNIVLHACNLVHGSDVSVDMPYYLF